MNKKIGVLLIHGMGEHPDDFGHDTIQLLRNRLSGKGLNRDDLAWESVYWEPVLSDRERQLWVDLSAKNDLNWVKMRRFLVNAFGSSSAYQLTQGQSGETYQKIHDLVHQSLLALRSRLRDEDKPVVVVAHSLGSLIMSNYIWDRQQGRDRERYGATAFERMETLAGFVTFGSTIPLFTLGHREIVSIEFPPAALPERLKSAARWINLYDPGDVLGWPLKPLSRSYGQAVSEDLEINVENILTSWNPASHAAAYWSDQSFIKPVANLLAGLLAQCGSPAP